jgi:hypothetical protein
MIEFQIVRDNTAAKLDELADLCEYWKRWRERGATPTAIRAALVMVVREIAAMEEVGIGITHHSVG